jgi:uncharacterized protein
MTLRLVLDTNVWLDWLVFDDPGILPLKLAVKTGTACVFINAACLDELERVLNYPLLKNPLDEARQAECMAACRAFSRLADVGTRASLPKCTDPDDQKFLELAAGIHADCLLSRDLALLAMKRKRLLPFHIMTPAEFSARSSVELLRQHQ